MTTIYLVRHGQTAWNKEEIFRGRADVPLSLIGLQEAESVGEYLKGMDIHVIYSSPLSRAKETARRIAQIFNLKVQLLVSEESWLPIQQKFFQPGGDYFIAHYTSVKVNRELPASAFQIPGAKSAKRVKVR